MSGVALTMISPSMVRPMRNTPCVEGCCGPMLMKSWSDLSPGTFSETVPVNALLIEAILDMDVVLAQRMAGDEIRREDLGQIRMAVVAHAQKIEGLALLPVRGLEQAGQAGRRRPLAR